jgi:hypothetical protein
MTVADPPADANDLAALARLKAVRVVQVHTDENGWCRGCIEVWARLAPFPCEQVTWARSVVDRYGDPTSNQPGEAR